MRRGVVGLEPTGQRRHASTVLGTDRPSKTGAFIQLSHTAPQQSTPR
jgi:hypothetical protein